MIAEHLEAAGDGHAAYGWHMRAATWATNRDIAAARLSWARATRIADALPAEDPHRKAMRIAPRTMLCGSSFRVRPSTTESRFDELKELCTEAGDQASLAIGMSGLIAEYMIRGDVREAARLASEQATLIESIGDPALTVALTVLVIAIKLETGAMADGLRRSQTVIDLAEDDPARGNLLFGAPLAAAYAARGIARASRGDPRWRDDLDCAGAMTRDADPVSRALVTMWRYGSGAMLGLLVIDDIALREIDEALHTAEQSADNFALGYARMTMGLALVHRDSPSDCELGSELLTQAHDLCLQERFWKAELPIINAYIAREKARHGDGDEAVPLMRQAVDDLVTNGQFGFMPIAAVILAETLLDRATESDVDEAAETIEQLVALRADHDSRAVDIRMLRLQALLARAHGDAEAYAHLRDRYRDMARTLGFEGHMAWADAMP